MARVVAIGAGLAGLVAARSLETAGHDVVLLDKGRSPGGRLATRRIGAATVDHGAQFFTVRSEEFAAVVRGWRVADLVVEWCRGFAGREDGYPRYRVRHGMNALAKHLAAPLAVHCSTLAFTMRSSGGRWVVVDDTTAEHIGDAVLITTPVPQAFSFLVSAALEVPVGVRALAYEPTLALLAVLDGPSGVPEPGGVQDADDTFSFVADNARKGLSSVPALTMHVRPDRSEAWWDEEPRVVLERLCDLASPWLGGARVVTAQLKRWRYATPLTTWVEPCLSLDATHAPVVLAGDAFGGPSIEGAVRSGLAAAAALGERLPRP